MVRQRAARGRDINWKTQITAMITAKNLTKRLPKEVGKRFHLIPIYEYITAVDKISFSIEEGEIVGLLGPNGAGKTTTIRLVTGILTPDEGEVRVMGLDPKKNREKVVRNIGAVFGHKGQLPANLRAKDAVRIISMYYDVSREDFEERFNRYADILGVNELAERRVRQLSLGERMRFEIMAALIHDPKILLLDEPTIGLDFPSKRKIRELIRQSGKTVIFTSHDAMDIEEVCDRAIILNKGRIVADTTVKDLKKLLGYKYAEITTEKPIDTAPQGWIKMSANRIRGRVSSWEDVVDVTRRLEQNGIVDVTLQYPNIEEVLEHVYSDTGRN